MQKEACHVACGQQQDRHAEGLAAGLGEHSVSETEVQVGTDLDPNLLTQQNIPIACVSSSEAKARRWETKAGEMGAYSEPGVKLHLRPRDLAEQEALDQRPSVHWERQQVGEQLTSDLCLVSPCSGDRLSAQIHLEPGRCQSP